ncbi:proliferation marker protein Ki-67 isoform X2 [Sus scrofa]|uniref:proliferation marker protein Ki-67 isoform X2 n=1 Tax=Sus scrofa TaxID=9823 RepID=UPI000A2B8629|nr:proliferation marker protein Ki-67 isoform X2 [Sus scrofa]
MGPTRRLVTIKRSGVDGPHFPLSLSSCLFGRAIECDIRIQLPVVSKQHCKIEIRDQEAVLFNFSSTNPTQVNGSAIEKPVPLKHGDVITIVDRSFRYENESDQNGSASAESPGQRREQESSRRASRSSISSNPGGKGQDARVRPKVTEEDVSGRALAHVTKAPEARNVSEDPAARRTPHGVHPSGQAAEDSGKAPDPAAGDAKEDSTVALGSRSGELKALSSMQGLRNGEQGDSPFRRLYESLKVELDVRAASVDGPQSRRKSASQGPRTTGGGSAAAGVQTPGSLTPRPKSGRSPQTKAEPAGGEPGRGRSLEKGSDGEPARSPSLPRTGTQRTRTPTPGRAAQPSPRRRRSEELRVLHGSESPRLGQGQSEGFRADSKAWMPRKFLPRNQTPVKVEEADSFATTPEKFSKKRKSISTNADDLATAVEMQAISAPLVLQAERKNQSDVLNKPEKLGTAAGQMGPGLPGLSSADISGFSDPMKKTEGAPPKRRRVSFGGRLRPELFDENLPPNTPLKRGETPKQRRSLATHTPAALKKIIKPQPSGKEDSSETHRETTAQHARVRSPAPPAPHASPAAPDGCRGSAEAPSVSSGSTAPHQTEPPRRGGRKSGSLPLKRASLDRGQHGILQMIYSRRRSGASEANLIVAKSWADVVKLGAKQTQNKAVKRGPPRPLSKKPRRTTPPTKPTDILQNQFSTGHANSPCTIVVGRAHLEKVTGPARPCRILNSFVPHKPMDFGEDLSGLTEMFKTPAKEKPHRMSTCASTFSNPEDLLGKKLLGPHPGEKPLLCTPEIGGGDVSLGPEDSPKEPADRSSESPVLRRPPIRMNESIAKTPRSVSKTKGAEMKSPGSEAELPKAASSANRPRRSSELRGPQTPGPERQAAGSRPHTVQDALGRRLGNTPLAKPELEGERRDSERPFESGKENVESKESSAKTPAGRRSGAASEVKCEPSVDLIPVEALPEPEPPGAAQVDRPGLWQTPARAKEAADAENRAAGTRCKPPGAERAGTTSRRSAQLKTPSRKGDPEGPSVPGKPTETPGATTPVRRAPGDGKSIKLFRETPEQKRIPAEGGTGSKRRPRMPEEKTRPLEDLAGLRELFQTPQHAKDPTAEAKTPGMRCQPPRAAPVFSLDSITGPLKTPPQRADTGDCLSALRQPRQTPGGAGLSYRNPEGGDRGTAGSQEAPEQSLDSAERVTGSKRRPRTPKEKTRPLEDLAGLRELFQTPQHAKDPGTDNKTPKTHCQSPQPEPVNTPSRKGRLKTPSQKGDTDAELSVPRTPRQTPGGAKLLEREPESGDRGAAASREAPEQKLDAAERGTGVQRRPRTPREKAQSLEDLAGFQELFQTPLHTKEPMAIVKTPQVSHISPQPEATATPTNRKRQLRTPLGKVVVGAGGSAPGKTTRALGETPHTHSEPGGGGESIRLFQETPEQKLDAAENAGGSRRRPRTPRERAQSLEDLAGFQELFQTPHHAKDPVTSDKTPTTEPVNTPASGKRGLRTPPQKVGTDAELSAPRKPRQTPEEAGHSDRGPAAEEEDKAFKERLKQKLDSAENVAGEQKRPRRTLREKVPPLEDLAGFQELFQTPRRAKDPVAEDGTPEMPCHASQAAAPVTSTSKTQTSKTPSQKADTRGGLSALRKPRQTPGGTGLSDRRPGGDGGAAASQEAPEQKLDAAERGTVQRWPRTPRGKAQSLEDLAGFQELFQTPLHTKEPMAIVKTPQVSHISLQPEATVTPTNRKRQLRTPLGKVVVEAGGSAPGKTTRALGETPHTHSEPGGGGESIRLFQETPEQKLDAAENAGGSKRRPRTPRERAQSLEDLAGFQELFQTPHHAKDPVTSDKTPKTEPVNTPASGKRGLRTPPQKVEVPEGVSGLRQLRQTPGDTVSSKGGDRGTAGSQEAPEQSLDFVEHITGIKRRPRTPKEKTRPLEDLAGLRELFQTPQHAKDPGTDNKTPKTHCQSPQPEPVNTPSRKGRLKTPSQKGDTDAELSVPRTPRQTPGGAKLLEREPESGDRGAAASREAPEQKLDAAERRTGVQRRPRTPREKTQSLEDLAGFQELFQTPLHTKEPMAIVKTPQVSHISPQPEATVTPTNRKRQLRTPLGKVVVGAGGSAPGKPTRALGETPHTHSEPGGGGESIRLFQETPEQKLDAAENAGGSKRWPRTPRERAQSLEDLAGFQELFQTPHHAKDPVTGDKTPTTEPVNTPASGKRGLRTPPQKVGTDAELSAPRKPRQTPEEAGHSDRGPAAEEEDKAFKKRLKQKLDSAENVAGEQKRPRRTLREKVPPLEDLAGFQELFQTPHRAKDPVADDIPTKMPCTSPPAEPVTRRTTRQRRLRSPPGEVDAEGPSAPRKPTRAARETRPTGSEPAADEKDIAVFKETSGPNLDSADEVVGTKSRLRSRKEKAQPPGAPGSVKEPFPRPDQAKEEVGDVKITAVPCPPPPAGPASRPTRQRRLRSPPGEVDAEGPSAPRRPTRAARETRPTGSEPAADEKDIAVSKRTSGKEFNPAESVSGVKSRLRTSKEKTQPVEDEPSLREPFPKPDQATEEAGEVKIAAAPCPPLPTGPASRPTRQRRLRSPPGEVNAEGPSAPRKPTRAARETRPTGSEPAADEKDIAVFKETLGPNLDSADEVVGTRSRLRSRKGKAQPPGGPGSVKEPFPRPDQAKEEVSDVKITAAPCPPPPAGPASRLTRQKRLRSPPRDVDSEGPSAPRRPTRAARETRTTGSELAADEKDIAVSKRTSGKELNPAESVSGVKSRLRTSKEKTQPVEDEPSLPKPDQATEEAGEVKIAAAPCPPPPAGPASRPTRQRRLRSPPGEVDAEGPSAPRKPTRAARETRPTGSEPAADEKDIAVFKETSGPNLDSADEVVGTKSRLRSHKEKAQPPGGLGSVKEPFPRPEQAKGLGNDAAHVKTALRPTAGRRRPAETSRSDLRASKVRSTEDPGGTSPSESHASPQREQGEAGRASGRKRLRPETAVQEPGDEKPLQKRQRAAPRERGDLPDPLGMKQKSLRVAVQRTEPVGKLPEGDLKTDAAGPGDAAGAPDKVTGGGMSLHPRRPNKTDLEEQRPECLPSAEKMRRTRHEKKSVKTSGERALRGREDGAENPTSGGKVQERQVRSRSGGQNKTLSPDAAERKAREKRAEIRLQDQEEKEATEHSGLATGLRSRKTTVRPRGNPSERDSEPRVTPCAKRGAHSLQKEDDNVSVRKIRTRSQKSSGR